MGKKKFAKSIFDSPVFKKSSTGVALYDIESQKLLMAINGDKRFTPASNTKLLTTLVGLQTFGKSLPVIKYVVQNDSLLLYPTGFPGFGYINDKGRSSIDSLIAAIDLPTKLMLPTAEVLPYGAGWAWDDVGYTFQPPRAILPLFGNVLERKQGTTDQFFVGELAIAHPGNAHPTNGTIAPFTQSTRFVPFYPDHAFIKKYFSANKKIEISKGASNANSKETRKSILQSATPFYKVILEDSDNFVSEQLLLMIANQQFGHWDIKKVTASYNEQLLPTEALAWVDGSGLSRYNAMSPLNLIGVIQAMIADSDLTYVQEILPAAGKEGSIQNYYKQLPIDHLFAKTGTLRHVHCLSGLLTAKSGKQLIFSFMHNQIPGSNQDWKKEMERVLMDWHQSL